MARVRNKPYVYKPHHLVPGPAIGQAAGVWFAAVPDKGYKDHTFYILYKGHRMTVNDWKTCATDFRRFGNKFGSGFYTLGYFLWDGAL